MSDAVSHRARVHRAASDFDIDGRRRRPPGALRARRARALHLAPSSRKRGAAASPSAASTPTRSFSSDSAATCVASRRRSPTIRAPSASRSRRTRTTRSACSRTSGSPSRTATSPAPLTRRSSIAQEIGYPGDPQASRPEPRPRNLGRGSTDRGSVRDGLGARERISEPHCRRAVRRGPRPPRARRQRQGRRCGRARAGTRDGRRQAHGSSAHRHRRTTTRAAASGTRRVLTRLRVRRDDREFLARSGLHARQRPGEGRVRRAPRRPRTSRPAARRSTAPTRCIPTT